MGKLVVQKIVSADGFAADDENEFTLFESTEGDFGASSTKNNLGMA